MYIGMNNSIRENSNLKDGLSGIIRAKNEAQFIEACIDSCIEALDELIIVYNDCTDETPEIAERKRQQYPDKIKVYSYEYHLLSYNLTKEEFEYAMSLPEDSPVLFCNQCNFALSKVQYKYAVLIDPDQLYFTDELKKWRDVCVENKMKMDMNIFWGWLFMIYFSIYRRFSTYCKKPCLWMLPNWLIYIFADSYLNFVKRELKKGKAAVALSGFNVFKDDKWYIPFDGFNIHPPYNGEGDHLIFLVTNETYFYRRAVKQSKRYLYGVSHSFHCPYTMMFVGPIWFHLHANREYCWNKVKKVKDEHPECFISIEEFPEMSYREVYNKMDKKAHTLFQMTLFALVHKIGVNRIKKHLYLLK